MHLVSGQTLIAAVALALPVCGSAAPSDVAKLRAALAKHTLPCGASFPQNLTRAELTAAFGATAVSSVTMYGAEGEGPSWKDSVLFDKIPADRLQISWKNQRAGRGAVYLAVADNSKWQGPGGVHTGSTITEIETANGKSFTFHGLGWDYGGVYNWNGGLFDGKLGGCKVDIGFDANPKTPQAATDKVEGERAFESNDPVLRVANPITISLKVTGMP
jgi:hypothetical protein